MRHSFDPTTLFCVCCGKSANWILDSGDHCHEGVIAISHLLAKKNGTWNIERLEAINAENKACTERRTTSR